MKCSLRGFPPNKEAEGFEVIAITFVVDSVNTNQLFVFSKAVLDNAAPSASIRAVGFYFVSIRVHEAKLTVDIIAVTRCFNRTNGCLRI